MGENFEKGGGLSTLPAQEPEFDSASWVEGEGTVHIKKGNRLFSGSGTIREIHDIVLDSNPDRSFMDVVKIDVKGNATRENLYLKTLHEHAQHFSFLDDSVMPPNLSMDAFDSRDQSALAQIDKQLREIAAAKEETAINRERRQNLITSRQDIIRKAVTRLSRGTP